MYVNIGQQQADNLNIFTHNLGNLNTFLNRLEETNKDKLTLIIEAKNSAKLHAPRPYGIIKSGKPNQQLAKNEPSGSE